MSVEQIAAEALRLPAKERALLAESLWESLGDRYVTTEQMDDAEVAALALARDGQVEAGQVQAISHADMMARLRR
jgi:putative addiction module component (TIGR02574 family)